MKNAGKACNNRLYRHIRTFEKIVKNYFVIYMKKQENVRYYYMRNIDSTTDFVLAYRKEMPVTGYMQRMIDMLMEHGKECEKIFPQVIRQHGCQNAF